MKSNCESFSFLHQGSFGLLFRICRVFYDLDGFWSMSEVFVAARMDILRLDMLVVNHGI